MWSILVATMCFNPTLNLAHSGVWTYAGFTNVMRCRFRTVPGGNHRVPDALLPSYKVQLASLRSLAYSAHRTSLSCESHCTDPCTIQAAELR
ncbi:hypothetical protein BD310DRAFT_161295 [Dichomitus squalens]|uniref:Secreted protein n=1 Tax=Dichomitus squalens TaxID=114155 RepID=A0A4Q9PEM3_9APHY|nr:hypothetical protein BD310DRAFT_161295 [Dichomitus squalens]